MDLYILSKRNITMITTGLLLFAATGQAMGAISNPLDSSAFDNKFEWDVDGVYEVAGFDLFKTVLPTVAGGTMVYDTSAFASDYAYFMSSAGQLWETSGVTWETGYTVETRMRVDTMAPEAYPATHVYSFPVGSDKGGFLELSPDKLVWGNKWWAQTEWTLDNSDDFHTFRYAQEPGADSFSLWRDDVLLGSELPGGTLALVRMLWGDAGGSPGGAYEMDYMRFSPGAYSPINEIIPGLPGDFDNDDDVDGIDFLTWQRDESPTSPLSTADLDDWVANFGATSASLAITVSAVPEPGTLMLLALGSLGLLAQRRRTV